MSAVPPDLRRDFGLHTVRLSRVWRNSVDAELRKFGLTAATWRPLFYLGQLGDGVRPKDLAAALDIEPPSVVQLVDRLESQGYVERRDAQGDRRSKSLHLTEAGQAVYVRTVDVSTSIAERLTAGISDEDLSACLEVFRRIEANHHRHQADEEQAASSKC